jgi:peptide/nickel transport system permease protein
MTLLQMSPRRARFEAATAAPRAVPRRRSWLRRNLAVAIAAGVLVAWLLVIVAAPLIAPADPLAQDSAPLLSPSGAHWLGTDSVGRDVFSRVLYGARLSVPLGLVLVVAAATLGTFVGLLAGFFGGWVDEALMRLADLVFSFPVIILAMAVAAALGPSLKNAVIAGTIVWWPAYARTVRSLVLSLRESDYVLANRLAGVGSLRSISVDMLPGVVGPVLVLAMLDVGGAILLLAGLSFLGLGSRPPAAEWGSMVSESSQYFNQWWIGVAPGVAIVTVVLAFNILGDALRDRLDPRLRNAGEHA